MKDYALSGHSLSDLLDSLPASVNKVVLVDACYSGGLIDQGSEVPLLPQGTPTASNATYFPFAFSNSLLDAYLGKTGGSGRVGNDVLVLTAAGGYETTPDTLRQLNSVLGTNFRYGTEDLQGPFTYLMMLAVQTGDLNGDGLLTVNELYQNAMQGYLEWNILYKAKFKSSQDLVPNRPRISGGPVDFVLFAKQ